MTSKEKKTEKYELQPPEGGWGYIIAISLTLMINVTQMPMTSFGLIFGKFLSSVGDETTGTTLANGIFNTCFNLTGLLANNLLQKYTYRIVAIIGAITFFIGNFATIFVTSLPQMIFSFGVIQGLGMGLMFPAFFTALNCYFDKRLSVMNCVAQIFMIVAGMAYPFVGQFCMSHFGFRGTVAIWSAASLNALLAAFTLQPVEWHMKKQKITTEKEELLLEEPGEKYILPKPRASIISLGDRAISVSTLNKLHKSGRALNKNDEANTWWRSFVKSLNLGMFKDPVFVNIALGLALGFTSDMAFISILPLVLTNSGYDPSTTAFFVSVFFGADLVARVLFSVISAVSTIKSRYFFLESCFLNVICRTAFVARNDYYWKIVTVSAVGFLRCFIQTPLPVVIAEQYSDNFATAFSLYMVVCGIVSLIFGPLMSFVKAYTHSDVMVVHLLSLAFLICVITWTIELVWKRMHRKK